MITPARTTLGKLEAPKLRASLFKVEQAIVTRAWPTLPALAPVGPSISTVGSYPQSRFSAVRRAGLGRKPHRIAVTVYTKSAEAVKRHREERDRLIVALRA
jgi:hypothetical protein